MKTLFTLLSIILMLLASENVLSQTTNTWDGSSSTSWNVAANWSLNRVPLASDNVVIPSAPANQPLISGTITPVCNNFTVNVGALLTVNGTSSANAQLAVNGTATFNGGLSIGGYISKTGKIIAANVIWNSSSSLSAYYGGRMEVSGNWTFASGSSINMGLCWVTFSGTANSTITNHSTGSSFSSLTLAKSAVATTYIGASSSANLTITGGININADNTLRGSANITSILKGNITSNGYFKFDAGTVSLEKSSSTQALQLAAIGNYFNHLIINSGGTVTIDNTLSVMGDITIQAGTFDVQNNALYITGDWNNEAGPEYFIEGTGKVVLNVIINKNGKGAYDQYINYSEDFNILEINNAYGDVIINSPATTVTCNQYDWTAGGIKVEAGTFTALDLVDDGIFGKYTLSGTGIINVTNNYDFVDLNGAILNISGGTMNVYGGIAESYWPYGNNSWITMSGGVLNFAETGIRISESTNTLTSNITGGIIKTSNSFRNYRSDFNPTGGTIELYGSTEANLYCVGTAALYGIKINKTIADEGEKSAIVYPRIDRETGEVLTDESRAQIVNLTSPVIFNGDFTLSAGTFNSNSYTIQAKRNWNNYVGAGSFVPGTGRVIFNGGNYHQYCYNETFNVLEVAKASGGSLRLSSGSVTCALYDWTAGSIDVNTGTFTANDLIDNGLYGGFYVNPDGTINLYQDASQYTDLNGNLTFTGGGTINVYGGNGNSQWAAGANASITMNGGTLDFKDNGITLTTLSPNTITENITGGTIRTTGGFFCNRSDFTPVGGILELYGSDNVFLEQYAGTLRDIKINKELAAVVNVNSNITVVSIEVASGTLSTVNKTITQNGHLYIENGGIFSLGVGAQLKLASEMSVNVNSGGIFSAIGTAVSPAIITRSASNYYYFNVNNGATMSAKYAQFLYTANIILSTNAIIDPTFPFDYCTFANGQGTFIFLNNNQELTIKGANFPMLPPTNTVAKTADTGHITFKDATGAYAGPSYEYDPYNRIDWTVTQPGLWTGTVSTDWQTSANWDDGNVPNAVTNVTIPVTAPYMPVIGAGIAYCKNITINGTLTMGAGDLNVAQNLAVNGTLDMNAAGAELVVQGDIDWNSGSEANITADAQIHAYGNWNFNAGANANLANGTVFFLGTVNKWIRNYSANCSFFNLRSQKTGGAQIGFSDLSTQDLKINGYLLTFTGSKFVSDSPMDVIVKGNITSQGTLQCNFGAMKLDGVNQSVTPGLNDYFNHFVFSQTGTVNLLTTQTNILNIRGDMHFDSGIFNAGSSIIKVGGNWDNNVGTTAFVESGSRVIFNGGNYHQYCGDETFNIIEVDKPLGGALRTSNSGVGKTVMCSEYDWTAGALDARNGNFTAVSLTDNGIAGNFYVNEGGSITLGNYGSNPQLKGNITMTGGTFNIIAAIESQWPGNGNASITMSDGELNVYPYGIEIVDNPPYTFTTNITGGRIRTEGSFINHRSDFTPGSGVIEFYGDEDAGMVLSDGSIYDLNINKTSGATITVATNVTITGETDVDQGTLKVLPGKVLSCRHTYVQAGGTLWVTEDATLDMFPSRELVSYGGLIKIQGTPADNAIVTCNGGDFNFAIMDGGTISASDAHFSHMIAGVHVAPEGLVDPDHAFTRCTFEDGYYNLLIINNSQDLIIANANFPTISAPVNAMKTEDQGSITFINPTGLFAGETYEDDEYNRIHWIIPQPGLWTGTVSTDWQTSANWDDGNVPNAVTDVTIPETASYMPTISAGIAYCKNITINGTLTIGAGDLNVAQNLAVNGTLAMNAAGAKLVVQGDIDWNAGSHDSVTADAQIHAYGNWNFNDGATVFLNNGTVFFMGSTTKWIRMYDNIGEFSNVVIDKTGGAYIGFSDLSTGEISIDRDLVIRPGSKFISDSEKTISIWGNLTSNGSFQCNAGDVIFAGGLTTITLNENDYFNHFTSAADLITVNTAQTSSFTINGNYLNHYGVFEAGNSVIKIGGDWTEYEGATFDAGSGRVIFNGGNYHQYCKANTTFNILEVDKPLGGALRFNNGAEGYDVICNEYEWTAGAVDVINGASFTAPSLSDNGIAGNFYATDGGTITLGQYGSNPQLKGNLYINGGTINIIAAIESQWPGDGNASITMSSGELNVYPYGIEIVDNPPYTFTTNITGGTIRTEGSFINNRSDFIPTAGTIELYGEGDVSLTMRSDYMGILNDLVINKQTTENKGGSVTVSETLLVNGGLNVLEGRLTCSTEKLLSVMGYVNVFDGATLSFEPFSFFSLYPGCSVFIHDGGTFESLGTESQPVSVNRLGSVGYYEFGVAGTISSRYTIFDNCEGLIIGSSGYIDPDNAFYHCSFPNANGLLLTINNSQNIVLLGVDFPNLSTSFNVGKQYDTGLVIMKDATGVGAGIDNEYDPFDRISWEESQPGLWTGAVSTDWHTAANWDDLNVPDAETEVLIPENPYSGNLPVIQQPAECKAMVMYGNLSILANELVVLEIMVIADSITINAGLTVNGPIWWQEGAKVFTSESCSISCADDWLMASGSNININGNVKLVGSETSILRNYSFFPAQFKNLVIQKTAGAKVILDETSNRAIVINGTMMIDEGGGFYSNCPTDFILKGNFFSNGSFECDAGTFKFEGTSQEMGLSPDNYFYNLDISVESYVDIYTGKSISDQINIHRDIVLNSGVLRGGNSTIYVGNEWINNVGNTAFEHQQSKVVFNSDSPWDSQFVSGNTVFNVLEVDQNPNLMLGIWDEAVIVCMEYDWTSGGIEVITGSFTAYNLTDNKIAGNWKLYSDAQINLTDENAIGLGGNIDIIGGIFNVYGGSDFWSLWPHYSDASLTMSGGILNFNTQSIEIRDDPTYTFTSNITGGKIMTTGWFQANNSGFNPEGGVVEIHGETNSYIGCDNGAAFYNLTINKSHVYDYVGLQDVVVKKVLNIDGGRGVINASRSLICYESVSVNNGWLDSQESSRLWMGNNGEVYIADGSRLNVFGNENEEAIFSAITQGNFYHITVAEGGYVSAENAIFDYLDETGVFVSAGATVDEDKAFNNCIFRNGKESQFPYLTINTNQDLILENVELSGTGRGKNVAKWDDTGSLTFVGFSGNLAGSAYEFDPYGRIFWQDEQQTHNIVLPTGWSGLSSYLIPTNPAMDDVFAPISDELIIAQTMDAVYYPGQNINTIGGWNLQSAYKIKTSAPCTLPITGDFFESRFVSLYNGWSLLPVPSQCEANVEDLFAPYSNQIGIVKDVAGVGVYWPAMNINTIGNIVPGKAYFVLMNSTFAELEFPTCDKMKKGVITTFNDVYENRTAIEELTTLNIFVSSPTPSSHTIAFAANAFSGFADGSIIGVFDEYGNCHGATAVDAGANCLIVFANDPLTSVKDGFDPGEIMIFKLIDPVSKEEFSISPTYDASLPSANGTYAENGMSAIMSIASTGIETIQGSYISVSVYPNPSTGVFRLKTLTGFETPSEFKWEISNTQGSIIATGNDEKNDFTIDISTHPKGIYYLKITKGGLQTVKKLVLQ